MLDIKGLSKLLVFETLLKIMPYFNDNRWDLNILQILL